MSKIIFISGPSRNDALGAAGRAHAAMFNRLGYEFHEVNLADAAALQMLGRVASEGTVEFAFGVMGVGADIGGVAPDGTQVNFWEATRVPYLSLIGDSPAYFFDRHTQANSWQANLYFFPEHLELLRRLGGCSSAIYGVVPPIPFDHAEQSEIDVKKKQSGRLLFLKNGNDPEKLVSMWRSSMPPASFLQLANMASELAAAIGRDGTEDIDKVVTEGFEVGGWDVKPSIRLRLYFVAQLDDYLRRVKSTMLGTVLREFPVDIRGDNWEHVDFSKGKATFRPGIDYAATRGAIIESLGIVDMSPNTQQAPHDRVMRAFGLSTFALTNRQRFLEQNFANHAEFTYRFDAENIRQTISRVLDNPKHHVELGIEVASEFRRRHSPEDFGEFLVSTASHIRLARGERPTGAQDYFVWPPATR